MADPFPRLSLGWDVAPFVEQRLGITLTDEQARRLFALYEVDADGRRMIRRAAVRRPKGIGKSPEGGYLALAELAGPTTFAGWRPDGRPIGRPHPSPLVQLAAVNEDQTDNVMVWLLDQLADNKDAVADLGLDVGRRIITRRQRRGTERAGRPGLLEVITAEAGSKEGARGTFVVLDQSESWTRGNGGIALAATLRRNAAKVGGWTYELQNAPQPGDGSVADMTERAAKKAARGVFYDGGPEVPEVKDLADRPALLAALRIAYGEAALEAGGWVDLERLADDINDPDTDPSDARRYYLNQATPAGELAFNRQLWITGGTGRTIDVFDDEKVVAGFDGSLFDDATALVVLGIESGTAHLAGLWEKDVERDGDDWQVPTSEVDETVADLLERWDIWRLYCDPFRWQTSMAAWEKLQRRPFVASWSTARLRQTGYACRNLAAEIRAGDIGPAEGETDLTRHMGNAVRRFVNSRDEQGRQLWTLAKPKPALKIDAAMALVLAAEARRDALTAGIRTQRAKRKSAGF